MRADITKNFNKDTKKYKDYQPRKSSIASFKSHNSGKDDEAADSGENKKMS